MADNRLQITNLILNPLPYGKILDQSMTAFADDEINVTGKMKL